MDDRSFQARTSFTTSKHIRIRAEKPICKIKRVAIFKTKCKNWLLMSLVQFSMIMQTTVQNNHSAKPKEGAAPKCPGRLQVRNLSSTVITRMSPDHRSSFCSSLISRPLCLVSQARPLFRPEQKIINCFKHARPYSSL